MSKNKLIKEIEEALDNYLEAYFIKRDYDKTISLFSKELNGFGTALDEVSFDTDSFLELYKRDFGQAPNQINYEIKQKKIKIVTDKVATVMCVIDIEATIMNQKLILRNLRASLFFVKKINEWLLDHKHISLPATEHGNEEAYPIKELEERNIALQRVVAEKTRELNNSIDALKKTKNELEIINEQKDKFFSIIAHDIRTPFTSLHGFSELLLKHHNEFDKDSLVDFYQKIYDSSRVVYNLLNNLLEWASLQMKNIKINIKRINPYKKVNEVIEIFKPFAEDKKISLINQIYKKYYCLADIDIFEFIMRNLISNAVKYTRVGGYVKFQGNFTDNNFIKIILEDNGIGMEKEIQDDLFKLRTSKKTKGTNNESGAGLGLIIVKDMIELIGGTIFIESEYNTGTKVILTLPTK